MFNSTKYIFLSTRFSFELRVRFLISAIKYLNKIGQPEFCVTVTFPFLKIHCRTLKADHSRSKLQFGAYVAADSSTISVYPMLQTQMRDL